MPNANKTYYLNELQRDLIVKLILKRREDFCYMIDSKNKKYCGYKINYEKSIQLCDDILNSLGENVYPSIEETIEINSRPRRYLENNSKTKLFYSND